VITRQGRDLIRYCFKGEVISIWIFGDVAFTVLPILIVAFLRLAFNKSFDGFIQQPEWSFATIVFFGLGIRQLREVKTDLQGDTSHKLDVGTQFQLLWLIFSVLCLATVQAQEIGIHVNLWFLTWVQLTLFVLGLQSLLAATAAKYEYRKTRLNLPDGMSDQRLRRYLERSIDEAIQNADYFIYASSKAKTLKTVPARGPFSSSTFRDTAFVRLTSKVDRLNELVSQIKVIQSEQKPDLDSSSPLL
jgi:hypothetical protein